MPQQSHRSTRTLVALLWALVAPAAMTAERPNIVFMMVDNLGYGDIGVYGGGAVRGAPTPHIDSLARDGLRLTNFNVEPECTPSRSALMTGRMPVRSALSGAVARPGTKPGLAPWEVTMAELLKDAGYATAMYGKWHLGEHEGRLPTDQGFDEWYGIPRSSVEALSNQQAGYSKSIYPMQQVMEGVAGQPSKSLGDYDARMRALIDAEVTRRSVAFIKEQTAADKPFFLYVPFTLPHSPALPNPRYDQPGKSAYQNVLREIDGNAGDILAALKEAGVEQNTIVVWTSDNGPETLQGPGIPYGAQSDPGPFRGEFPSAWEGAIRTPALIRWPGQIPAGRSSNGIVSIVDFYSTFAHMLGIEGSIPSDRAIDSVDQSALFLGKSDESARDHVMFFYDGDLLAIKWRNYKAHLVLRNPIDVGPVRQAGQNVVYGVKQTPGYPWIFDYENDPKELWNIAAPNSWIARPVAQIQGAYMASVKKFPNLKPGAEKP